ncbi:MULTISPECIES: mobile mystery protein B [Sphingobacterium]|uniref:Mobile mystery protein B n=1 Tax=Sphingobacterium litopenaei TaxID=2763500 RepID=A0ABR7YIJ3_9SPHI|nr:MULTISPECIES: mobile mystery protein B [Sphingobacterium]MBD1431142.1 mobile mystery protein B [Sphingobacterium litopenaei]NGM74820.1 mobile mystery protein B [Sphingobacterium sp. SGL-16]
MGLDFEYNPGQTPLDPEEIDGLLIDTISTRGELDEFEQQNIEEAVQWVLKRRLRPDQILREAFICQLHQKMYGDVWSWAGQFRNTEKNIGIARWRIGPELRTLLDDTLYWVEHNTYPPEEIALRFKHRIVSIHCFPNGNGRHSRLMADIIIDKIFKQNVFSWGAANLVHQGETRVTYLQAVRAADAGDIGPLIEFARS